jgi:Fic family protein
MATYIHQRKDWPEFTWNSAELVNILGRVRHAQGRLAGKMESLGFDLGKEAVLETMTLEALKSTEIEGEHFDAGQVRSSIARRLGMDISGLIPSDRNVDGMVDMMMDATQNFALAMSSERLFDWHAGLFPTGRTGIRKITVGNWRTGARGPMQVVSGAIGKEKVHFEAPDSLLVEQEMGVFIDWFNRESGLDPVIRAGVAHLWFLTIHPFDDGNGRIARALTDMLLARADGSAQRFYSMSAQIRLERKGYYAILEETQKGDLDITGWLNWFLGCLLNALDSAEEILARVLAKSGFWKNNAGLALNERQIRMLNRLMDDFEGKMTSRKWARIAGCSDDTALRDIRDLMNKGILSKDAAGGRSTSYVLNFHSFGR